MASQGACLQTINMGIGWELLCQLVLVPIVIPTRNIQQFGAHLGLDIIVPTVGRN